VPKIEKAFANISSCLASDGLFYLGVNGAAHFSASWRPILHRLGFDINEMLDGARLRKTLSLLDNLSATEICSIAKREPALLSGDLFGPLIRNLSLRDWVAMCARADLHFLASAAVSFFVRPVINHGSFPHLIPRTRADISLLMDILQPASFHALLFCKRPPSSPPWANVGALLHWRPLLAPHLRKHRWPRHRGAWKTQRTFKIKTPATNTLIHLRVPEWLLEILRQSQGQRPLRQILRLIGGRINYRELQQQLYLLHHLDVLSLEEPASA
jgi:hypothetical protein